MNPPPRHPSLVDFHCPCCKRYLGSINRAEPGLTWCRDCAIEISTKPIAPSDIPIL